jgi:phosphonate transport system substrate-binding protein
MWSAYENGGPPAATLTDPHGARDALALMMATNDGARPPSRRAPPRPLRVATHLAPGVLPAYARVARSLGEELGRRAELVVAADYARCAADVDHVCFVCSVPYLLLRDAGAIRMEVVAAPVLSGRRYGGRPVYFSDVVVRADSRYRRFADLRGTRWAYNEPYSHSGFVVVLHHLAVLVESPDFLGTSLEAGFHDEALRMVLDGRADWAAIDSQVLAIWMRQVPSLRRRLRVVEVLGPSTIQPVVASARRLGAGTRRTITEVLLAIHEDPSVRPDLRAAGIERFVAVGDAHYDDIRDKLAAAAAAGLLPAWWLPRWHDLVGSSGGRQDQAASTIGLTSPIQRSSVSAS